MGSGKIGREAPAFSLFPSPLRACYFLIFSICIGNSMICSDIWHKYHEWCISKLLYVISRAVRRVKFETILKYHEWYLCQISRTNHAIICLYYYPQRFVIFTCRYFILSWNTTALSQWISSNFSCSSIVTGIPSGSLCGEDRLWTVTASLHSTYVKNLP